MSIRHKLYAMSAVMIMLPLIHGCGGNSPSDQTALPPVAGSSSAAAPAPPGANAAAANGAAAATNGAAGAANGAAGTGAAASTNGNAANADLAFTVKNDTNGTIKAVYVTASSKNDWGDSITKSALKKGDSLNVDFSPKEKSDLWDVRVEWADDNTASEFREVKLSGMTDLVLESENGKRTAKIMNGSDIVKTVDAGPANAS